MDVIKKIKPIIIFFFKKGVVTFLNLVLPSSNPVKKDKTTKNGRKNESHFHGVTKSIFNRQMEQ